MTLPVNIKDNDPGHSGIHNDTNVEVNRLTEALSGLRGLLSGVFTSAPTTGRRRLAYDAAADAPDVFQVEYDPTNVNTEASAFGRLTLWFNERGLLRLQQAVSAKWDVPLRIFGPVDGGGFGSNILEAVTRRKATGPQDPPMFAVAPNGRVRTSLYAWQGLTMGAARFTAFGDPYNAPGARLVSDDVVELRGVIANATAALAVGDVIATLPEGMGPAKDMEIAVANATGAVNLTLFRASDRAIVNQRASGSGAGRISLDGIRLYR